MNERKLGGRAPTLALLVDWLEDEYQSIIMRAVSDAATERGVNLICLCGGVVDSPVRNGKERNGVFALAAKADAVIVLSGALGNYVGPEKLAQYCERFATLPRCSIGIRLPTMPSVLVDNDFGMRSALEHLVEVHAKRRILFVRGPDLNDEAERRFAIYCNVHSERGLPVEPDLCFLGDFQPEAGYRAVIQALDNGVAFDAVAAANDSMALGALKALRERNVEVPKQVALVGFDDVEEARFLDPPLSTVAQPLYEQGKAAVRVVMAQLQGDTSVEDIILRTQFVVRRSCGCLTDDAMTPPPPGPGRALPFELGMIQRRSIVLAELLRSAQAVFGGLGADWEAKLFASMIDELGERYKVGFLQVYNDTLQRVMRTDNHIGAWHGVLTTLRKHVLACAASDLPLYCRAETLFQEARLLTSNVVERAQARKRLDAEHLSRAIARASAALIASFDRAELYRSCTEQLPALGISFCAMVNYSGNKRDLAFAFDSSKGTRLIPSMTLDEGGFLPPHALPERQPHTLIIVPLSFKNTLLGYCAFSLGPRNGTVYESLRDQISAALFGADLAEHGVLSRR